MFTITSWAHPETACTFAAVETTWSALTFFFRATSPAQCVRPGPYPGPLKFKGPRLSCQLLQCVGFRFEKRRTRGSSEQPPHHYPQAERSTLYLERARQIKRNYVLRVVKWQNIYLCSATFDPQLVLST